MDRLKTATRPKATPVEVTRALRRTVLKPILDSARSHTKNSRLTDISANPINYCRSLHAEALKWIEVAKWQMALGDPLETVLESLDMSFQARTEEAKERLWMGDDRTATLLYRLALHTLKMQMQIIEEYDLSTERAVVNSNIARTHISLGELNELAGQTIKSGEHLLSAAERHYENFELEVDEHNHWTAAIEIRKCGDCFVKLGLINLEIAIKNRAKNRLEALTTAKDQFRTAKRCYSAAHDIMREQEQNYLLSEAQIGDAIVAGAAIKRKKKAAKKMRRAAEMLVEAHWMEYIGEMKANLRRIEAGIIMEQAEILLGLAVDHDLKYLVEKTKEKI